MTRHLAFINGTLIAPDRLIEDAILVSRDGIITAIKPHGTPPKQAEVIDARGGYIAPGYVDLHIHGGGGADFMDGTADASRTVGRSHLKHGTTPIFPTTTTGSVDQIMQMLAACREVQADQASTIAGVHLYGPYFAPDKVGCHSEAGRRSPTAAETKRYLASGIVSIATCAAELPGADAFYRAASKAGCFITCGHSNASWHEMQRAFQAGMRHVDHFWCAMSSVPGLRQRLGVPMQASMAEFVLMNQEMSTEVIADGCHLSPELLEFAYRMLGPDRLCLVTDCNRALDMPPGDYRFGHVSDGTWFHSDGQVGWAPGGQSLASSVKGMDHMVRTMKRATSASLPEVIRMASLTPARRVGLADRLGSLERGKLANILVLNKKLEVKQVFLG
ncbi:MAG: N-acetylglucosamine-6-phosphate deacetylase [Pirellulaceae bacterium]|nr:N-acetylglucosamine-6-phosphate deacetylase [Pirellulaceae bacterium]